MVAGVAQIYDDVSSTNVRHAAGAGVLDMLQDRVHLMHCCM